MDEEHKAKKASEIRNELNDGVTVERDVPQNHMYTKPSIARDQGFTRDAS